MIKSNEERIQERELKIEQSRKKIKLEQDKISNLEKEIQEIKNLEIQGLLKETNLPYEKLKELILNLKNGNTIKEGNE